MIASGVRILRDDAAHLSVHAPGLVVLSTVGALSSRIVLSGDLDLASAPALEVVVDRSLAAGPPRLEIDLAELRFLGVAGITVFHRAGLACAERGGRVVLERAGPHARTILGMLGCQHLLG